MMCHSCHVLCKYLFKLNMILITVKVDEAKQELKDVVEFLKNPEKFSSLGGKLPKGKAFDFTYYKVYTIVFSKLN